MQWNLEQNYQNVFKIYFENIVCNMKAMLPHHIALNNETIHIHYCVYYKEEA